VRELEEKIDKEFRENPLMNQPFCVLYNLLCQTTTRQILDEGQIPFGYMEPFCFIFEHDLDFTPISLDESQNRAYEISLADFKRLIECANLNIVFPLIHSGVYSLERKSESESIIDYTDSEIENIELRDTILTNISLPRIAPIRIAGLDFARFINSLIERKKKIEPIKCKNHISKIYRLTKDHFIEEALVPDEVYIHIGFSESDAFLKIRNALCSLGKAYIDAAYIADKYIQAKEIYDTQAGNKIWSGLAMACIKNHELKEFVLDLCKCTSGDYEKFKEFFFCTPQRNKGISNKFMPPFWQIADDVYFMPCAVPTLLSTRNLLISIQNDAPKKHQYRYDESISKTFEPALLRRAEKHFKEKGYSTFTEKKYTGGELDLLVYCKESHTILTVQAKATLFPESARMVRRLEDRVIEAIEQTKNFDSLSESHKAEIFRSCFDSENDLASAHHIRGVLTNSSFGSYKSWRAIEGENVIPLNCNLLRNSLPNCKTLAQLPAAIKEFIDHSTDSVKKQINEISFNLKDHTIRQRNIDTSGVNELIKSGYMGG
jgi:hypothetical protein